MCNKKEKHMNRGITLIALIVTIIILLILAGIALQLVIGESGIIARAQEANFKAKMSSIAEEWELDKMNLSMNGESTNIYAGEVLKKIAKEEELEIEESAIQNIRNLLENVGQKEENYVIVHEGELYYVSQNTIKNNKNQVKWCEEIGIKIWDYVSNTGIKVVNGNYELVNGIYLCTPQLNMGFSKDNTRYLNFRDGNLIPGTWINKKPEDDWYDYKNQKWANLYVEANGVESYYVWIPRYVYKKDTSHQVAGNERMDIKFVDLNNNYQDGDTGEKIAWEKLRNDGYQLPEAFWWDNNGNNNRDEGEQIHGYWMSKYQLSNLEEYTIDYNTAATVTTINVQNITINTDKTIAKYTYAINGNIVHEFDCKKEGTSQAGDYLITGLAKGNKVLNVTALDENGEIIGSMTQIYEVADVNPPDLRGFDKDTTFYVYWDREGNEHNEIPISKPAPEEWYDYTSANWANIVVRNDGLESYYVWIPRYEYKLDGTSKPEKSIVKFIKGIETTATTGYQVPEAFWWDNNGNDTMDEGEQLTGYWMSKYQLSKEDSTPRMNAEMTAGSNIIRIGDITGTLIEQAIANNININYEYYINGDRRTDAIGNSNKEQYIYEGLSENTTYTINIIARNKDTNEYIGAVTKKMKTVEAYAPDVSAFNKDCTYYVVYKEDGEQRISLNEKAPEEWYDYTKQEWANIVTTNGGTESYFVWIPRYEYKILEDRENIDKTNRRIDVNFITTDITNENCTKGYQVPEAFWWDNNGNNIMDEGEQLQGYWMSKYQLSNY